VPAQCLKRHAGLELTRKPPSRRHLVSLRYTAEYTLTPRPIFQDRLTAPSPPSTTDAVASQGWPQDAKPLP
ncbi:MAG: hypothetical protein ACREFD_19345, partial [Stellaceae bacterium]